MRVTRQKEYRRIISAMDMLNKLENVCIRDKIAWIPFIKDKLKRNMIYQSIEKTWHQAFDIKITNDVFELRKYYPPEYYK